jgi:hypothetical protein
MVLNTGMHSLLPTWERKLSVVHGGMLGESVGLQVCHGCIMYHGIMCMEGCD